MCNAISGRFQKEAIISAFVSEFNYKRQLLNFSRIRNWICNHIGYDRARDQGYRRARVHCVSHLGSTTKKINEKKF